MPVSDGYLTFVIDQLRPVVAGVRARRMFGGIGLYANELFFAVIDDDTLFLKVDDVNRPDYQARGMPPFQPIPGEFSMNYHQLPEELLEDVDALRPWATRAVDAARRARAVKRKRAAKREASTRAATSRTSGKRPATERAPAKPTATRPAKKAATTSAKNAASNSAKKPATRSAKKAPRPSSPTKKRRKR